MDPKSLTESHLESELKMTPQSKKKMMLVIKSREIDGEPDFVGSLIEKEASDDESENIVNEPSKEERKAEKVRRRPADYVPDCDYDTSDAETVDPFDEIVPVTEPEEEDNPLVHYRINFRCRNRVLFKSIYIDPTEPIAQETLKALSLLKKNEKGEVVADFFQFLHQLKLSTYKNKYLLQLGEHKMQFSERDDSLLISHEGDTTVHMRTSKNTDFRNRNMVLEELQNLLKLNFNVDVSVFKSERSEQMGEMKLEEFANSITTRSLTIDMDSYQNVVQIINLYRNPVNQISIRCLDDWEDITSVENVRTAAHLKIGGDSVIDVEALLRLEATKLDINTKAMTSDGLRRYIETALAMDLTDEFNAIIRMYNGAFDPTKVFDQIDHDEYESEEAFIKINVCLPVNVIDPYLARVPIKNSARRLAVILTPHYFECRLEKVTPQRVTNHNVIVD